MGIMSITRAEIYSMLTGKFTLTDVGYNIMSVIDEPIDPAKPPKGSTLSWIESLEIWEPYNAMELSDDHLHRTGFVRLIASGKNHDVHPVLFVLMEYHPRSVGLKSIQKDIFDLDGVRLSNHELARLLLLGVNSGLIRRLE